MGELVVRNTAFKVELASLEEILSELSNYGSPRVSKLGNGWYAVIEVFVTGKGVEFKCNSEHNHHLPSLAVIELHQRLMKALKELDVI